MHKTKQGYIKQNENELIDTVLFQPTKVFPELMKTLNLFYICDSILINKF